MKIKKDLAIIIVNWNGKKFLSNCFNSLKNQTYQNFRIIFVDNGSTDRSVKNVKNNFIKNNLFQVDIKLIELSENTGFAKGNNIGISEALKDKNIKNVVLLNNDTKVENDFLEKLVDTFNDNKFKKEYRKIGALAPKILLWNKNKNKNIIDAIGAKVSLDGRGYNIGNGEVDTGQYNKSREVFGFCGGATLLKRKMLEDVKLTNYNSKIKLKNKESLEYQQYFDDSFFAYYEDTDLSWRMRLRGWQSITVPKAVIWHIHSGTASPFSFFKAYYLNRNRFLMMLKNYPFELLCKGLLLVPKSYFNLAKTSKGKKYIYGNKRKLRRTEKFIRKIKMIGVLSKAGCSIFWSLPKTIKQRHQIQKIKLVTNRSLKKWLEE